jgi:Lrp/AsnC family leucine-responsive transcriptional regulator
MTNIELDTIDRRILDQLQRNGRISNVELAGLVGLSPSPCLRRVRDLEDAGVIDRYAAILDQGAAGFSLSVFVQVTLERQIEAALEAFERVIAERPEVMECYLMTGDADYLLRIVVPDVAAYETFLKNHLIRIQGISSIKSSFALNRVKYETALPLNDEALTGTSSARRNDWSGCDLHWRDPFAVLIGKRFQRKHARAAVELISVWPAKTHLKANVRDAVRICPDQRDLSCFNHFVLVNPLQRRPGTHILKYASAIKEKAAERTTGVILQATYGFVLLGDN